MINKLNLPKAVPAKVSSKHAANTADPAMVDKVKQDLKLPIAEVQVFSLEELKRNGTQVSIILKDLFQRGIPAMIDLGDENLVNNFIQSSVELFRAKNHYDFVNHVSVGQKKLTFPAGIVKAGYDQEPYNRESFLYVGPRQDNHPAHEKIMPEAWKNYYGILSDVKDSLLQAINPGLKELTPILNKSCSNLIAFHYFPAPHPKNNQQPRADYYVRLSEHIDKIEIFTLNLLPQDDQMEVFFNNSWHALRPTGSQIPIIPGSQWKVVSQALWNEMHPGIRHRIVASSEEQANSHRYSGLLALRLFPEKTNWRKQLIQRFF